MNMEVDIRHLQEGLEKEIQSYKKSSLLNIVIGLCAIALFFGYYYFLSCSLKTVLDEKQLALVTKQYILNSVPEIKKTVQIQLKKSAPGLVSNVLDHAEKLLPRLRAEANAAVKKAVPEMIDNVDLVLQAQIREKATPYRQSIEDILEKLSHDEKAEEEFEKLEVVIEKAFFDEVDHIIDMSYFSMAEINRKIDTVMNVEDITEEQLLEKKFLKMWVNFFKWNYQEK